MELGSENYLINPVDVSLTHHKKIIAESEFLYYWADTAGNLIKDTEGKVIPIYSDPVRDYLYNLDGSSVALLNNLGIFSAGSYTLQGSSIGFIEQRVLLAENSITTYWTDTAGNPILDTSGNPIVIYDHLYKTVGEPVSLDVEILFYGSRGIYEQVGVESSLITGRKIISSLSSYNISPNSISIFLQYLINLITDSYEITGGDLNLGSDNVLDCNLGDYTVLGSSVNLIPIIEVLLNAEYSLTGQDITSLLSLVITGETDSYSLTGGDLGLLDTFIITLSSSEYLINGTLITTSANRKTQIVRVPYNITGQTTYLRSGTIITIEDEYYVISGTDADVLKNFYLLSDTEEYLLLGSSADINPIYYITSEVGYYGVSGKVLSFIKDLGIISTVGSYLISGEIVFLHYSGDDIENVIILMNMKTGLPVMDLKTGLIISQINSSTITLN